MSTLAILAALPEEVSDLLATMGPTATTHRIGMREFHVGKVYGHDCIVGLARIGKVAAAATTVTLVREFGASAVVVTGLAGGIHDDVRVGDVVVAASLLQYDLDASPLFPRYEVPLLGRAEFVADARLGGVLREAAEAFVAEEAAEAVDRATAGRVRLGAPRTHVGLIATGDRFVSDAATHSALQTALPRALCVEMEGGAVAQVCHEFGVPFAVVRTISDRADQCASEDFPLFLAKGAGLYSAGILRRFLGALPVLGAAA